MVKKKKEGGNVLSLFSGAGKHAIPAPHSFIHSHFLLCILLKIIDAAVMIGDEGFT